MFRKPMRLEKWIAFDGAIGAEVVTEVVDPVDAPNDGDGESFYGDNDISDSHAENAAEAEASEFGIAAFGISPQSSSSNDLDIGTSGPRAELELPIGITVPPANSASGDPFLPFLDGDIDFDLKGGASIVDFFYEISHPSNGKFTFLTTAEADASFSAFVAKYNLQNGDYIVLQNGNMSGTNKVLEVYRVVMQGGGNGYFDVKTPAFMFNETATGLRIGCIADVVGNGEDQAEALFMSLAFKPDVGADKADSFSFSAYYKSGGLNLWDASKPYLTDEAGGVFNQTENPPKLVLQDATQESNSDGSPKNPGPEEPGPEEPGPEEPGPEEPGPEEPGPEEPGPEEPGPVDPPVEPPVTPTPPSPEPPPTPTPEPPSLPTPEPPSPPPAVDAGTGDGAEAGDSGEADASDDGQDDGGSAGDQGDGVAYVHHGSEEGDDDDAAGGNRRSAAGALEDVEEESGVRHEEKALETAAAAAALELMRDVEIAVKTVREDRVGLEKVLARLRDDYFELGDLDKGRFKDLVRDLFESGNQKLVAMNRILEQMNARMGEFRNLPSEQRDGMLTESIRELLDSASRRSGETGALSKALDAVCDFLEQRGSTGDAVDADELARVFNAAHAESMAAWQELASRSDPMGRDLERSEALRK